MRAFRRWFEEFDAELWDRELERDVVAGKLDRLADAAVAAHKRGEAETFEASCDAGILAAFRSVA